MTNYLVRTSSALHFFPSTISIALTMSADDDMWAMMGLPTGFGKQTVKKKVDIAARMDSNKRVAKVDPVCLLAVPSKRGRNT